LSVFLSRIAALTGIDASEAAAKVSVSSPPKPLTHYPESRQAQMAGATLFQVTLQFTVTSTEEADRIISACLAAADSKTRPLAPATLEARKRLFSDFQLLSIKWVTEEGRVDGLCPFQYVAERKVVTAAPIFEAAYLSPIYRCPSSFYRSASECTPCPDKSTSDMGAESLEECAGFVTIVLAIKDPSVSFTSRTTGSATFGGSLLAQPDGYSIMNYQGMQKSASMYQKTRGYALHLEEDVDQRFPTWGKQAGRCSVSSNCFNASAFREEVSAALNGHVLPNEIHLLPPLDCSSATDSGSTTQREAENDDLCGLWPRHPQHADGNEFVCSRPPAVAPPPCSSPADTTCKTGAGEQKCFWTIGASYIGVDIGSSVETQLPSDQLAATVAGSTISKSLLSLSLSLYMYIYKPLQKLNKQTALMRAPTTTTAMPSSTASALLGRQDQLLLPLSESVSHMSLNRH
jgi:hypothetical protein